MDHLSTENKNRLTLTKHIVVTVDEMGDYLPLPRLPVETDNDFRRETNLRHLSVNRLNVQELLIPCEQLNFV